MRIGIYEAKWSLSVNDIIMHVKKPPHNQKLLE